MNNLGVRSGVGLIFWLAILVSILSVYSLNLEFQNPTPGDNAFIPYNWSMINISIENISNLDTFIFNWNNTNYTFYDDSLILSLNFNNNSLIGENGSHMTDISKYGNNGSCSEATCPTWNSSGRFGGAYMFDGEDDYIDCGNDSSLNFGSSPFTVEAWIQTPGSEEDQGVMSKFDSGGIVGWSLNIGDHLIYCVFYDSVDGSVEVPATTEINDNFWHLLSVTRNDTTFRIYIDGILEGEISEDVGNINIPIPLTIGYAEEVEEYFTGIIDGVRLHNRALSADEVLMHYRSDFQKYNSSEYRFYTNITNLTDGSYTYYGWANDTAGNVNNSGVRTLIYPYLPVPSCSCIQYPPDIDFTNIGSNVFWDCNCSGESLNHSSFMWLHSLGENWSFRPPDTLMSDEERRACRRYNKTLYPQYAYWYEYISDLPQLTDNIYVWGVHDYQSAKVDLIYSSANQSNYSVSALFDHLMVSEWDINRVFLQSEYKVNDFEPIYANKLGAKKFTKGSVRANATYSCYINLESQGSNWFTSIHYCNESLVLLHEADPMSKDYCHFIDSFQDSVYAYSVRNSSYVGDFLFRVNDSGFIDSVEAGSTYYLLVSLSENSVNKATKWHYADAKNITGDGVGFNNINRSFYSSDNGDSWITGNYSFDIVCRYAHPDNDSLNWFVYLCTNDSVCWNSSVSVDVLGAFDNSPPNVLVISPGVGEVVSDMYNLTWDANDPDGDPLNFSGFLFYSNGSLHSTLFSDSFNYSFLWNSSSVGDGSWVFNVTAFDPSSNSSSAHSFLVDNIPDLDIMFWVYSASGSPVPDVSFTVRNASNDSLWSDLSDASGYALYPSIVYGELFIYLDFPAYSAVLSNVSGDSVVYINDWVSGRVRLSNSLGAFLEDQDCSVVVYDNGSVVVHDYDTRCRAGSSFVDRHGDWVSIGNCSLSDSGGWYFFKGRVDESMGFEYNQVYDLVFTCNGQTGNFSFTTSFEKTPLDMAKTEDFIRNYSGFFIVYGVFGFLCLLTLIIIIILMLFVIKKN